MKEYQSNEEFFQAFQELIRRLDDGGNSQAAQELRQGFSCLNGLTDGWALLMESIQKTVLHYREDLLGVDAEELEGMLKVVRKVVYER
jgi:hypothetical protein